MKKGCGSILIVEDNPGEQLVIKEAFHKLHIKDAIHTVNNGAEAIDFLKGRGQYIDRQRFKFPTFLLIDLKMPKLDGFELLLFLKRSKLIIVPIVVFTSSSDPEDIKSAYLLGANAFHTKPAQMESLLPLLKKIYDYWTAVEFPELDDWGNLRVVDGVEKLWEKIPAVIGR